MQANPQPNCSKNDGLRALFRHVVPPLVAMICCAAAAAALSGCGSSATAKTAGGHATPNPANYLALNTMPEALPPKIHVTTNKSGLAPGLIFLAPKKDGPQRLLEIADNAGQPIWLHPINQQDGATNFHVQQYHGKPVLTWWEGFSVIGHGSGVWHLYNTSYQPVATVAAGNGLGADEHEMQLEPDGTAYIDAYHIQPADLSKVGGPKHGFIFNCYIQQIDVATGRVLWQWSVFPHVPLNRSFASMDKHAGSAAHPWDYFHINSVDLEPNGNLIVSARNTHAIYELNRKTGAIIWQMGGKHSSFAMGKGTEFAWQHDARRQADGTITLFDDAASPKTEPFSRALRIKLDMQHMKASLVQAYVSPEKVLAGSQGSMQVLPNGNVFVGWGAEPYFSEFAADGTVLYDAHFNKNADNYRAFRDPWTATPKTLPTLALTLDKKGHAVAWASWNGATQVAKWALVTKASPKADDTVVTTVARHGFETKIPVPAPVPTNSLLEVEALDASGNVLATSAPQASLLNSETPAQ